MKRLLLWLIGVALGVVVLLAAVLGVSYSFTSEGAKPASEVQFAGQELEPNGWCWQVPLLGGQVDKVFASPRTLTVQKLGVLYDAHPAFALPEWYSYGPLTITDSAGNVVFEGTAATYDDFLFPANGDYKAELTVWRLPENMLATQFEGGSTGALRKNLGLEKPAKPTGWYHYSFRFTLQASAEVELSAERVEQGGIVGVVLGSLAGYYGKWVDAVIMRLVDIQLCFPFTLLALFIAAVLGSSLGNVILIAGITSWVRYARLVRGEILGIKEMEYIEAIRAAGGTDARIIFKHILPNIISPVIVIATLEMAKIVLIEASLSFLGYGVPITIPTWGRMLSEARDNILTDPWQCIFPGLCITLTVLGVNLLGDWLRDYLDPKLDV